jgi:hypothetical protein
MFRHQLTVRHPRPEGTERADHGDLIGPLEALALGRTAALVDVKSDLDSYVGSLAEVDPDRLARDHALAYWLNLYNAGALTLAAEAFVAGEESVLRVPGAFSRPFARIAGESLSLDAVEHAKIRRFGDPRIHSAIVCGSVSCPTLRAEPYAGDRISVQLDDQMRAFLRSGGAAIAEGELQLSRVFLWYGADFVRPARMPTWIPATPRRVAASLRSWMEPDVGEQYDLVKRVGFQPYDWGLRCSVG